uniref:Nucleolar complex protein n=1 Tax=Saccharum hybrid cultivar R570 TaxID=131158 RepID=A0A059Q2Z3_9POAL|nr:hypothetical protein [Saccharum hybrid cultivar R570]
MSDEYGGLLLIQPHFYGPLLYALALKKKAKQHVEQLKRLQQKDPEFYKYLEQFDKDLLGFDDDDDEIEDDQETGVDGDEESVSKEELKHVKPITMEMVDSWCNGVENEKIGSIRSILQAFRRASCRYGEDHGDNSTPKFSVMSGSVLDKVMHFVLKHMDRVLRQLLGAPNFGGKKEAISELMLSKPWKRHGNLMRIYLANALHMITEMTDEQMIAFTIHRVRASAVFLAAFPSLLRKYVKVLGIFLLQKSYQKIYEWQYIFCLELWTSVVCGCSSEEEFRPLAYPLTQIIHGVACLVPSARYFPVRLRCVRMLNRIAEATGTFIPVSSLQLDMLEMKELRGCPDGGVGKAVNLFSVKQIEANVEFIKSKRVGIAFSPNDPAIDVIVGAESSTFSRRLSEAQKQQDEQDNDEGTIAFSKNWLAENKKPKYVLPSLFFPLLLAVENTLSYHCSVCRTPKENKKRPREDDDVATEEDRVEDLVLSSDEEDGNNQEPEDGFVPVEGDSDEDFVDPDSEYKKQKKAKLKKRNKRQPLSHKAPSRTKRNSHPKKKTRH